MSKLYNPELIPKEELKRTFVGRHKLIEEIVSIIKKQPKGAGVQHLIIVAPRGMGKTTLLLMLRFEVEDSDLSANWQAVQFPEESYDIYELSDFWIKVAEFLAADTNDENLRKKIAEIKSQFTKNEDLYEAAYALLKDWRRENGKKLVLLIDNFDMILEQINSELDAARLRKVLMNEDTVMLIGSAVTFFQEVRGYDHPLYNFFKIYNLEGFKDDLIKEFLIRRANEEGIKDFDRILGENRARIKTLAYFTDGNPRLVLMLFDVITNSKISDVEKALEILLDEVTPYFKSKIELLPPQQRKILDYIARMSFEKREGVTPTEISAEVRLTPNQTSSQLKRLAEDGYIKAANVSGRSSFYVLSEPLVAIWYQMRFGRTAYQKRRWLIFVLKGLYELEELRQEQVRLGKEYKKTLGSGQAARAKDILKHQLFLAEAMPEFSGAKTHFEHFVSQSLILKNESTLKEELKNPALLTRLSPKLLDQLQTEGYINEKQCSKAKTESSAYQFSKIENDSLAELIAGQKILAEVTLEHRQDKLRRVLEHFNRAIELNPENLDALRARASFFYQDGKFREAISDLDKQIEIIGPLVEAGRLDLANDLAMAFMNKGVSLDSLGNLHEAITEYDKAIEIRGPLVEAGRLDLANDLARAFMNKGVALDSLGNLHEAITEYDKAIEILWPLVEAGRLDLANDLAMAFMNKGVSLDSLGNLHEAITEYDKAIEIRGPLVEAGRLDLANDLARAFMNKGVALDRLGNLHEAITEYDKAIEIRGPLVEAGRLDLANDLARAFMNKGNALYSLGNLHEAITEYDKAIEILWPLVEAGRLDLANDLAMAFMNKGVSLRGLGNLHEAITEYDKAIEILGPLVEAGRLDLANDLARAFMNKGVALDSLGNLHEAITEYDKAIEIIGPLVEAGRLDLANDLAMAFMNKGVSLYSLGNSNEAITESDKAIELFDDVGKVDQTSEIPINRAKAILNKAFVLIKLNDFSKARESIRQAVESLDAVKYESLNSVVFNVIFSAANGDDYSNIRKLLSGEELETRFFPILRAIDYLETKNKDLIEKLSPEVRGVVEVAVRALMRDSSDDAAPDPVLAVSGH